MGSRISLKDFILLRLQWRPFPAEILDQSCPSSRPHTAKHFSTGTELSGAVKHMFMVLMNRDGFNDTLMTNTVVVSVHVLQMCHHLMGHSLLCSALLWCLISLPVWLLPHSLSFIVCTALYTPFHPTALSVREGKAGVMHPLGWVLWYSLCKLSEGSMAQEPGASPAMEWDAHMCILRICQTRSQTFQRQNISYLGCLT